MPQSDDLITVRYAADADGWVLNGISANSQPLIARGPPGTEPDWLAQILTAARIGGYCMDITEPPPTTVLWFVVTKDYQLHKFREDLYGDAD